MISFLFLESSFDVSFIVAVVAIDVVIVLLILD